MNILQTALPCKTLNTNGLQPRSPGGRGEGYWKISKSNRSRFSPGSVALKFLWCEEFEDVLFILSTEARPHPHMANHGAGQRWRQLLRSAMTPATVRREFSFAYVGLLRRRFSRGSGRFRRCGGLSEDQRRTCNRCDESQLEQDTSLHFDLPFQTAGKRNR
jgi:hypothetical protein